LIDLNSFNPSFLVNSTDGVGHVELEKLEVRDVPNDEIELSIEGLKNEENDKGLILIVEHLNMKYFQKFSKFYEWIYYDEHIN